MKKYKKHGIPYMGSKRAIAGDIIEEIHKLEPDKKVFYDLFGGGGAISFAAIQSGYFDKVVYNEFDSAICALLSKIKNEGVTDEFYSWVSREEFYDLKNGEDWKSGLIKTCWSFGNQGSRYLYSKDIEKYKKAYHYLVVDSDLTQIEYMQDFIFNYVKTKYSIKHKIKLNAPIGDTINQRRLSIRRQITSYQNECKIQQLRQLQQLQHLERLQQLERLEKEIKFEISNKSYEDVEIDSNSIIYLDPPYQGKAKYQNDIDHNDLKSYILNTNAPIFMSEYKCDYMIPIWSKEKPETLAVYNHNRAKEVLYYKK